MRAIPPRFLAFGVGSIVAVAVALVAGASLRASAATLQITTNAAATAEVGAAYSQTVTATVNGVRVADGGRLTVQ